MITLKRLTAPALKHLRDVDLWLPRRGATLIEGPNESGKSTLFEAIYFALYGRPLVGEEPGKATLSALIPHDGTQAQVTLTLLTGETELEVTRTLTRARNGGPTSEAALVVRQPGRPDERVNAVSAVNDRILAELRGLDGDTLRNSCFMEQKGLERLESLRRDEREEAISRLLGLERLVSIERSLAPSAEERRRLEHLRAQARVAAQQRRMREASAREGDVSQRLQAAELREWMEERDTLDARLKYLNEEDQRLTNELGDSEELLSRIDSLRVAERRLAEAERLRWRARQVSHETTLLTTQLEQLDAIDAAHAPEAERKLDNIRRLEDSMREVARERGLLEEAAALLQRGKTAEESQQRARALLTEAERSRSAIVTALARSQARETLSDWIHARERADLREGRTQQLAALNTERGKYEREIAETRALAWQWLALTGAALALALVAAALALAVKISLLWVFVVLAGVGAVALGIRWRREAQTSRARAWRLSQADQGISTVSAEVNLAKRLVNDDIGRLEANLRAAGMPIPASAEEGERILRSLPSPSAIEETEMHAHEAETQAARARIEIERAVGEANTVQIALRNLGFAGALDQIQPRLAEAKAREQTLAEEARSLELPDDISGLARARGAAEANFSTLLSSRGDRNDMHTRMLESSDALEDILREWADDLERIAATLEALGFAESFVLPEPLATHSLEAAHDALGEQAQQALAQYDEPAIRARQGGLIAERERLAAKAEETSSEHERLREQIRGRLATQGMLAQGDESLTTAAQVWPLLGEVTADEVADLRAAREDARLEAYHSEQTVAEREREIMLEGAPLDEAELRAQLSATEQELRRRELACELASEVRGRIIRRALPETEVYMRALLPELTAGRYHDITLLRDDVTGSGGESDLSIRMWDQVAGRYVRKNLFSGGTRDQASLALRLAFALATLPKELGATPGFIFLDEPLSAFDTERSLALARVLTTGAIAQSFAQVFLISHSQVIEPQSFDYILRMDGGQVVESTLPTSEIAETLWDAEASVGEDLRMATA